MRSLRTGVTDQTIVVHCFDSDEAAVTLTSGSAGLAISYRLDTAGREGTPVSMTPVARLSAGVHRDGAITSKGDGKHEIDLPDAAFASAGYLTVILSATSVTGRVYSEVLAVGVTAELDSDITAKINALSFDEEVGTLDVNVKHYRGTLQSNGDLPQKMDAVYSRLGAPAGASIAADIASIEGGGGGGGDATLAKQEEILEAVEGVTDSVAAYAARLALEVQLRGFPNVICRNADYLEETESEIRITMEDLTGTAITEIAGTPVASLSWLFGMGTEAAPNLIDGTCTWDGDSDELVIEIAKAATVGKQTGSLTWQIGVSIGTGESIKTRWLGGGTTRLIERQF